MGEFARTWREYDLLEATPANSDERARHRQRLAALEAKLWELELKDAEDEAAQKELFEGFKSRVTNFFDWYKHRAGHARAMLMESKGMVFRESKLPEFHVLIGVGLDSLANKWECGYGPKVTCPGIDGAELKSRYTNRWRFGEFLRLHGGAYFDMVAVPDLCERAKKAPELLRAIERVAGTVDLTDVRKGDGDVSLSTLTRAAYEDGFAIDEAWARRSLYGEILYTRYRCQWIHEFEGSPELEHDSPVPQLVEPHYMPTSGPADRKGKRREWLRPVFTAEFLLRTYEAAIESFEKACRRHGCHPCHGRRLPGCARPG